jgi:hypothetical protein
MKTLITLTHFITAITCLFLVQSCQRPAEKRQRKGGYKAATVPVPKPAHDVDFSEKAQANP